MELIKFLFGTPEVYTRFMGLVLLLGALRIGIILANNAFERKRKKKVDEMTSRIFGGGFRNGIY